MAGFYLGAQELLGIQSGGTPEDGDGGDTSDGQGSSDEEQQQSSGGDQPADEDQQPSDEEDTSDDPDPAEEESDTASDGPFTVDDFEDESVSGWEPVSELTSTFEPSRGRSSSGSWSVEFSEGSTDDNPRWENVGTAERPTTLETAHALENGEIYADSYTEWRIDGTVVFRVNYNWSNNFLAVNGSGARPSDIDDGAVVADLPWPSSDEFFGVTLDEIDWEANVVGVVRVNGTEQARDVPFFNDADSIDRTTVSIGGDGGNVMFVDDTSIPPE
ncbi:hypothetical protein [Halorubrum sp. F4]|uniref:hypothetical protein n=1 Tax=Halorubrum sp. F4 TaxID=2989715 RepID=UPI002481547A|nr:hypothetical protein [Halorubrum sp. F4]